MSNILVIDDEVSILEIIKIGLEKDNHNVTSLSDPSSLLLDDICYYDIILLDIMMPQKDGFTTIKEIRSISDIPIIFLSADSTKNSINYGLGLGADDYLMKPLHLSELRARINAHLRREKRKKHISLNLQKFSFNLAKKELYYCEELIALTKAEYEICEYLAKNRQYVFSKEQLYTSIFGYTGAGNSHSISTHIKNIRQKLSLFEESPIKTKWGVGYFWD